MIGYLYIFGTVFFTVYGQLVFKWRMDMYIPHMPSEMREKVLYMVSLTLDPFIFSGFLSAFLASLCWMMVLTKFQLSYAYPFMSASFILVLFLSMFLFHESLNFHKLIGLSFIIIGLIISSKGL